MSEPELAVPEPGRMDMKIEERVAFLSDVPVGILATARGGKGPLALPIWYLYEGGDVIIGMDGGSLKAKLLRAAGRATMTVQTETPPYNPKACGWAANADANEWHGSTRRTHPAAR